MKDYGLLTDQLKPSGMNDRLEIIYVQPSNKDGENNIVDFSWIADWLDKKYQDESFEKELAKALRIWAKD